MSVSRPSCVLQVTADLFPAPDGAAIGRVTACVRRAQGCTPGELPQNDPHPFADVVVTVPFWRGGMTVWDDPTFGTDATRPPPFLAREGLEALLAQVQTAEARFQAVRWDAGHLLTVGAVVAHLAETLDTIGVLTPYPGAARGWRLVRTPEAMADTVHARVQWLQEAYATRPNAA